MERVGSAETGLVEATIVGAREKDRQSLREAMDLHGGPTAYLRAVHPRLAAGSPVGLSEAALLAETTDWYQDSEARLALCETCPPAGGACAKGLSILRPGQLPVWREDRLVVARCKRYAEWRLGERLALGNVPERYRAVTLRLREHAPGSTPEPEEPGAPRGFVLATDDARRRAVYDAIVDFAAAVLAGETPWLVLAGPHGTGKTHLACAVLRGLPRTAPRTRFWYADMHELKVAMKGYDFRSDDPDPLDRLRETDVLVLDNLDPKKLGQEWWLKERIEDVLYGRWNRNRATLITTHATHADLVDAFETITTLREAPSCSLA